MIAVESEASVAHHIINNMIGAFNFAVKSAPHAGVGMDNIDGSYQYFSGSAFPLFNGVFSGKNAEKTPHEHMSAAVQFFSSKNVPFAWWWLQQSPLPEKIKNELDHFNLKPLGIYSGIAAKIQDIPHAKKSEKIEIKEVLIDADYQSFIDIICDVFQLSESIKIDYNAMFKSYGPKGVFKHYLGYYEGEPVSTVTSYVEGNAVGLYSGATLPKAQKKGLCTALIQRAVHDAKLLGCDFAIAQLMAPGMAKGLTDKLGFSTYCELLPFVSGGME